METYDTDHDGSLSDTELAACPGILRHKQLYDKDGNGTVSQREIEVADQPITCVKVGVTSPSSSSSHEWATARW